MLHALLRRKLHPSIPEPERLEDALTSAVFGPLLWMRAWTTLLEWFGDVTAPADSFVHGYWFWPRLELAEPDVMVRIGDRLFVVEAKFGSGRHDVAVVDGDEGRISDQIVRQYESIKRPRARRLNYDPPIEAAIAECRLTQLMVVDARRLRRARREYVESLAALPAGADLRLVTWQQLHTRLLHLGTRDDWVEDVIAYLDLVGVDSFNGVGHGVGADPRIAGVRRWRAAAVSGPGWKTAFAEMGTIDRHALQRWGRGDGIVRVSPRLREGFSAIGIETILRLRTWSGAERAVEAVSGTNWHALAVNVRRARGVLAWRR